MHLLLNSHSLLHLGFAHLRQAQTHHYCLSRRDPGHQLDRLDHRILVGSCKSLVPRHLQVPHRLVSPVVVVGNGQMKRALELEISLSLFLCRSHRPYDGPGDGEINHLLCRARISRTLRRYGRWKILQNNALWMFNCNV